MSMNATLNNPHDSKVSPVIMLEFNELTPTLMDRFIMEGHLPNFARLRNESHVFVTDAEEEGEDLNPWVQWVTLHSGLTAAEHGVKELSSSYQLDTPAIWDQLSEAGYTVWVCGSMNPWYSEPLNGHLLPDAWSAQTSPYPVGEFEPFYNFVRKHVQEHCNKEAKSSWRSLIEFSRFMLRRGLSLETLLAGVKQVASEKLLRKNVHWKRAVLLDRLQWDVFRWYYDEYRPAFSTFFLNSTAHYQHKFWRNLEPEKFVVQPTEKEQAQFSDAILFGYQQMDKIVGKVSQLAGDHATVILASGLGQQPFLEREAEGGKRHYRVKSAKTFAEKLGIAGKYSYEPVMADQFFLRFELETNAIVAANQLTNLALSDREAFYVERKETELYCQCRARGVMPKDAEITQLDGGLSLKFHDVFYQVDGVKSGYHHPDGILWVSQPAREHIVHDNKISLRTVAPGILGLFGLHPSQVATQSQAVKVEEVSVSQG